MKQIKSKRLFLIAVALGCIVLTGEVVVLLVPPAHPFARTVYKRASAMLFDEQVGVEAAKKRLLGRALEVGGLRALGLRTASLANELLDRRHTLPVLRLPQRGSLSSGPRVDRRCDLAAARSTPTAAGHLAAHLHMRTDKYPLLPASRVR